MDKHILQRSKRPLVILLALMMVSALLSATVLAADYDGHWSQENIEAAQARGWMVGYPDGTFRPDNSITRAEFVVMLWRVLGEPQPSGDHPFMDIAADAWYYNAVAALYEAGIVSGMGDNLFAPDTTLTREMGFAMLARAFNLEADDMNAYQRFSDVNSISDWARGSVSALTERGYVGGVGDNQCAPQNALTRGETAKLLIMIFDGERGGSGQEDPNDGKPGGTQPTDPEDDKPGDSKPTDPKDETTKPDTTKPDPKPEVPAKDETGPIITLVYSPTASTTGKVTITVTAEDDSDIAYIGWRSSSKGKTYTSNSGFTNITNKSEFAVSSNGWYAVCATDTLGNFSYELIQITNIKSSGGGSSGGGGSTGGGTVYYAVTGVTISGNAWTGATLTATITPSYASNVSYQWYVSNTNDNTNGTAISGATGSSYTIDAAHAGKYIYVVVSGYNSSRATSTQTAAVLIPVAFTGVAADGNEPTGKVTLSFDKDIEGLTADDITLTAGATGAEKGTLARVGVGRYELTLTDITASGSIKIEVTKEHYVFTSGNSKTVNVLTEPVEVTFVSAVADGTPDSAATTKVTLTFSADIADLKIDDITLSAGTTGATKGTTLERIDTGEYDLALVWPEGETCASGDITITINKMIGYTVEPSSKTVGVVYYVAPEPPTVGITVTRMPPLGGTYSYTVSIKIGDDQYTGTYVLYIFHDNAWTKVNSLSGMTDYAVDSKCILVLDSAEDEVKTAISSAFDNVLNADRYDGDFDISEMTGVHGAVVVEAK